MNLLMLVLAPSSFLVTAPFEEDLVSTTVDDVNETLNETLNRTPRHNWQTGSGGDFWDSDCNFSGYDISSASE